MKFLLDMNLSPKLVSLLGEENLEVIHWADVGDPRAEDSAIFSWAQKGGYCIITNDLDFGDILAATNADCPSVIQVRTQNIGPVHIKPILLRIFHDYKKYILDGALITFDELRSRVRVLPIRPLRV